MMGRWLVGWLVGLLREWRGTHARTCTPPIARPSAPTLTPTPTLASSRKCTIQTQTQPDVAKVFVQGGVLTLRLLEAEPEHRNEKGQVGGLWG